MTEHTDIDRNRCCPEKAVTPEVDLQGEADHENTPPTPSLKTGGQGGKSPPTEIQNKAGNRSEAGMQVEKGLSKTRSARQMQQVEALRGTCQN